MGDPRQENGARRENAQPISNTVVGRSHRVSSHVGDSARRVLDSSPFGRIGNRGAFLTRSDPAGPRSRSLWYSNNERLLGGTEGSSVGVPRSPCPSGP